MRLDLVWDRQGSRKEIGSKDKRLAVHPFPATRPASSESVQFPVWRTTRLVSTCRQAATHHDGDAVLSKPPCLDTRRLAPCIQEEADLVVNNNRIIPRHTMFHYKYESVVVDVMVIVNGLCN